jgi:hypothetical protein
MGGMFARTSLLLIASILCHAQAPTVKEETVHGRKAWVLENGLIRVSLLRGGGHIAEARLLSSNPKAAINPMRVPHYPTMEPYDYVDSKHNAIYGDGPHRWLHSGYMGHLLCFPHYGPPSAEEAAAGLGNHGEAPIVEWHARKIDTTPDAVIVRYGAELNKTQFRVERAVTLQRGKRLVRIEEWIENLAPFDRPINWMQHATFGNPFVEPGKTMLDASATRGLVGAGRPDNRSLKPDSAVQWPEGINHEGAKTDLRAFQARPQAGTYYALLMDQSRAEQFFTLYHTGYRVLIGYLYPTEGNLWLADWQENRSNTIAPWNGQAVARGMEFGSSPFAEGLRKSVERASLFGVPAYRWIGGRQKLKTEFTIFLEEIPEGYKGVKDARMMDGRLVVAPR